MNSTYRSLAVFSLVLLGLWGCSQGPSNRGALVERIKVLETRSARMEEDFRAVSASRDQVKQQLVRAEEHIQTLQVVVKERDELKVQLQLRTSERDQVAGQYDQFRQSIREVLGQADTSVLRFPDGEPVAVTLSLAR